MTVNLPNLKKTQQGRGNCIRHGPQRQMGGRQCHAQGTAGRFTCQHHHHQRVPAMLNYTAGTDAMQAACAAAEIRTIVTSRAFVEQAKLTEKLAVN